MWFIWSLAAVAWRVLDGDGWGIKGAVASTRAGGWAGLRWEAVGNNDIVDIAFGADVGVGVASIGRVPRCVVGVAGSATSGEAACE